MRVLFLVLIFVVTTSCKDNKSEKVITNAEVKEDKNLQSNIDLEIYDFEGFKPFLNKKDDKTYVVNFWATWCGPCIMMAPVVEELAADFDGKAIIGKLDVDQNPETAQKFGIRSIPTMMVFKDGEVVDKVVCASSKVDLQNRIDKQMA